ncbi:hypothetical protein BGZ68_004243 [Mortierella alpina]|nr:hypothetical protein BGZ68_004243 [Mortierella alpina]
MARTRVMSADVTEMHGLAIAARNGIRAGGRLAQLQQSPVTLLSRTATTRQQQQQHSQRGQSFKKPTSVTLLRSRDSGIMLDEEYWHHNNSSSEHDRQSSDAEPLLKTKTTIQDPGLLILQVTQFGTIDHAFAIPQSSGGAKRSTGWSSISSSGDDMTSDDNDVDDNDNKSVFLAHDRVAIEAMTSDAVMAYVHPQELSALCKGLDQVCKARYTVFRARWRVDAPSSESKPFDEDDDCSKACRYDENLRDEDRRCRIIEFQGERFEEWVDPSSAAMSCSQAMSVEKEEVKEDEKESSCRYAWTEVTGVLSNGNVVLVVRPLTMPEVEEQEWLMASSPSISSSSFSPTPPTFVDNTDDETEDEDEDEDGYLEMELEVGSLCSEQTLVQDDGESKADWRAWTDEVRKRMDFEEGLCLSKAGNVAVSRLSDLSSFSSSSVSTVSSRPKLDTRTIETISFGMTILGCAPRPSLSAPSLMDYDYCNFLAETDGDVQKALAQELCQRTTVITIPRPNTSREDESVNKTSGLNRAGKVLEAHYPGLEGVVRHFGQSWLGHRIMETVQLEEKLDVVADQVVDWWESEDRVAALVASSVPPLLNTLTAYTPLSFLSRRFINGRTTLPTDQK